MQIIISPAKKMRIDNDDLVSAAEPRFLKDTEVLLAELRKIQYDDLKKLWQCNDEIAALNYKRLQTMCLRANLTPAVLAYDGIQYQYMAPHVFEYQYFRYLYILSGFLWYLAFIRRKPKNYNRLDCCYFLFHLFPALLYF